LYWIASADDKLRWFSEVARKVDGAATLPAGTCQIDHCRYAKVFHGSDGQVWIIYGKLYAYVAHPIVVLPNPISVQNGSTQAVTVSEKGLPQKQFTAISADPAIAAVSGTGENFAVTGVSQGTTVITFSDKIGNSLDVSVTVQ